MNLQKINKRWLLFAIAVFAQFATIFYWAIRSEETIAKGTPLKFRLRGFDPHDPFRGEYLRIQFQDNSMKVSKEEYEFMKAYEYLVFDVDYNGYATPAYLSEIPAELSLKVKTNAYNFTSKDSIDSTRIWIDYPFDRIWMNQEEAPIAEKLINKALQDEGDIYAIVSVKDGDGILTDVEINGFSIKELVKQNIEYGEEQIEIVPDSTEPTLEDSIANVVIEELTGDSTK